MENNGTDETIKSELREEIRTLLPWVSLPDPSDTQKTKHNGLIYLYSFRKFYIYKNIQIFDKLLDSPKITRNCLTVRNKAYQQIYYIGTDGNRTPGKYLPFTLRVVDQYNQLVILVKKSLKLCFMEEIIYIECPPGVRLAKIVGNRDKKDDRLFLIYSKERSKADSSYTDSTSGSDYSSVLRFIITRNSEKKNRKEFKIMSQSREPIASIRRRYEKILAVDKSVVHEDHYTRVNIDEALGVSDKAIILSATLIVDIFLMNNL